MTDIHGLLDRGARAIATAVLRGDVDLVELAEAAIHRAETAPDNALVCVDGDVALSEARALADRLAVGERPPLAGVPVAHKDLLDTASFPTTYGHPTLTRQPTEDAVAVTRAAAAGVLQVGKANLHEVAYGVTGQNPHTGTPTNPRAPDRIPGGSSSGSAAAVAAGSVVASLGTDSGGSVRIPAACCGVVGLKTTRGAVPTTGALPLSALLDTVGPIAGSVDDAALLLAAVAGPDHRDPVSRSAPPPWEVDRVDPRPPAILLLPAELWNDRIDPQARSAAERGVAALADAGAEVREVSLERFQLARRAQGVVIATAALAVHEERLARTPEVFGDDIRARLETARGLTAVRLVRALDLRRRWIAEIRELLGDTGLIASPTLAFPPPEVDTTTVTWADGDEEITPALTRLTGIWNLAGFPAIAVPCGDVGGALPGSLQIVGPEWSEPRLLAAAAIVETAEP